MFCFRKRDRPAITPSPSPIELYDAQWRRAVDESAPHWSHFRSLFMNTFRDADERHAAPRPYGDPHHGDTDLGAFEQNKVAVFSSLMSMDEEARRRGFSTLAKASANLGPHLSARRWPATLKPPFAESHPLIDVPLPVRVLASDKASEHLLVVLASEIAATLASHLRADSDSVALTALDARYIRFDWWAAWPENRSPSSYDSRYSYMVFELGLRGNTLWASQHTGTLWFQEALLGELVHILDADLLATADPISPYWRIELVNNYKKHLSDIHRQHRGLEALPLPLLVTQPFDRLESVTTRDYGAGYYRACAENRTKAARFHLEFCDELDSLVHFTLKGLRLGRGAPIAHLFAAARETAERVLQDCVVALKVR